MSRFLFYSLALLTATGLTAPVLAQDAAPDDGPRDDHPHGDERINRIVITSSLPDSTLLENIRTLEERDIVTQLDGQIGEVLETLPGVSTSGFAPGASRPVVRGLDGDRVKIMVDSLGVFDASGASADHGVSVDPLLVDHIDVIQGPAALLFGGEAIGGAVNVIDRRIPREMPVGGVDIAALATYGTAADYRALSGAVDYALDDRFVVHLDATLSASDDLRVGGRLVSDSFREELLAEAEEERELGDFEVADELEEAANASGRVPNTFAETSSYGAGIAFIDERGSMGVSVRRYDTRYGIPERPGGGHEHGEGEEEVDVAIDLGQTRVDFRGELEFDGFFESALLRFGFADYGHIEFEGDEVGTTFAREAFEGRLELVQRDRGGWHGHMGLSFQSSDLAIIGEEAFFPGSDDRRLGAFLLQAYDFGPFTVEGSARYDAVSVASSTLGVERDFDLLSGGVGLSYRFAGDDGTVGAHYLRTGRAPSNSELLSNGLHVATQAFETGDATFDPETSNGFEAFARYESGLYRFSATGFLIDFDGFISAFDTGLEEEGFPVLRYRQVPAQFRGFELDGAAPIHSGETFSLTAEAAVEYVHAERENAQPVPRIPPLKVSGGLAAEFDRVSLSGEVAHYFEQKRVEAGADPVAAYTLVNAALTWRPLPQQDRLTLALVGNNLFDVVGRRATSFTRDFVPVSGRDFRLTAKLSF